LHFHFWQVSYPRSGGLRTNEGFVDLFCLPWPELLVIWIGYAHGTANLFYDIPHPCKSSRRIHFLIAYLRFLLIKKRIDVTYLLAYCM
jgi:hypothetical protein